MSKKCSNFAAKFDTLPRKRTKNVHLFITLKTHKTMAKQSGIHQIRGKVGEMSYYSQTGVSSGLLRKINQGLSDRVKTSEEYANTRLNNTEFGAAANVAGLLGQMVLPKFRPMVLPFSQSKMAKEILKVARQHTDSWGQRVVTSADTAKLCDILSSMSKRNVNEFVSISLTRQSATAANVAGSFTEEQATLMASLGITNLSVVATQFDLATGQWNPLALEMATGYLYQRDRQFAVDNSPVVAGTAVSEDTDIDVETFVPEANHSGHQIVVFVVLPMRQINSVNHILQEYCSFVAMPLPANA